MARLSQSSLLSPEPSASSATSKKRKSSDSSEPLSKKPKFAQLKPHTKKISQELIRAQWKSLPKLAQQAARDLFLAAKRTTLMQITDGPRRREAEFVVNDVLRRLERQVPRMPFPPGTKKEGLELDGVLEGVVSYLLPREFVVPRLLITLHSDCWRRRRVP